MVEEKMASAKEAKYAVKVCLFQWPEGHHPPTKLICMPRVAIKMKTIYNLISRDLVQGDEGEVGKLLMKDRLPLALRNKLAKPHVYCIADRAFRCVRRCTRLIRTTTASG